MTTTLAVLPIEWNEVIIRGDDWVRTYKVPGDYDSAGWIVRARVGGATPFIDLDQTDMTITYDSGEEIDGVTGWTTVTFDVPFAETVALPLTRAGNWSIRSSKGGIQKTWFAGSIEVQQTALTGASYP